MLFLPPPPKQLFENFSIPDVGSPLQVSCCGIIEWTSLESLSRNRSARSHPGWAKKRLGRIICGVIVTSEITF
ncbi:unnamed protein product [Tuber melanosporum]|uniref:(Perigord truffle) hypothetical protein n=1 Tax=Tuber melanosporum (strain Mel28) TaxID=656061 RepID=D5G895_TUBMM|nr:uncharacterized protein GSTUM_00002938001 [Tuber melanosporum]CAZ80738.1 unnamed protein product [Tuber melanosporum]